MASVRLREQEEILVDPSIWRATAGNLIHVPTVDSRVYYFPQGHMDQVLNPPDLSSMAVKHSILCRVLDVSFLGDVRTDEVFVKFQLEPLKTTGDGFHGGSGGNGGNGSGSGSESESENDIVSYARVLTNSDTNEKKSFPVPTFLLDSVFPPLDLTVHPTFQCLYFSDINGEKHMLKHVCVGTPKKHLLSSNSWTRFVNQKCLIGGDTLVFIKKKSTNQLHIGIRRTLKKKITRLMPDLAQLAVVRQGELYWKSPGEKLRVQKIVTAVERATSELGFEVVYYPKAGRPEFVVAAEKVEVACGVNWSGGMKVKLAQETEDGRLSWYNGTIESVLSESDQGQWAGSPWRKLQVNWEESDILQNFKTVSPWQVELIDPTPTINDAQNSAELTTDGEGNQSSSAFLNLNTSDGMQRSRQNLTNSSPGIMNDNNHPAKIVDENIDSSSLRMEAVSTDHNIAHPSSETHSLDSQNNVQLFGLASNEQHSCNLTKNGVTSSQLLSTVIQSEQPSVIASNIGSGENNSSEGARITGESTSLNASNSSVKKTDAM